MASLFPCWPWPVDSSWAASPASPNLNRRCWEKYTYALSHVLKSQHTRALQGNAAACWWRKWQSMQAKRPSEKTQAQPICRHPAGKVRWHLQAACKNGLCRCNRSSRGKDAPQGMQQAPPHLPPWPVPIAARETVSLWLLTLTDGKARNYWPPDSSSDQCMKNTYRKSP